MKLDLLLKDIPGIKTNDYSNGNISISGISTDPNLCRPGFLYLAAESEIVDSTRYGERLDGRDFILPALQNGAVAVVSAGNLQIPADLLPTVVLIEHHNPMSILGLICANFYEEQPKAIALVTGTNGKTSTVNFSRQLWTAANLPACSVGNLGGVCSDGSLVWPRDRTMSIPDTVTMHSMLKTLASRNINHVAMEATSHALYDYRLTGVAATIGAFTNLTRDHLDFHQTLEEYFRVKMTLFTEVLPPGSSAVINADDTWFEKVLAICKERGHRVISFGWKGADIRLLDCVKHEKGQTLDIEVLGKRYKCQLSLFGLFQASNVLCSLGIVIASGVSPDQAVKYVESLHEVEGRLNFAAVTPSGGQIVVDFAHTPDGIRAALEACKTFTKGKLFSLFGCDGERDPGKRSLMGEMASSLADQVIVTNSDPRAEDPAEIRRQVLLGAKGATEIGDREEAIAFGVKALGAGDTLLITGRFPMLDAEAARQAVSALSETVLAESTISS